MPRVTIGDRPDHVPAPTFWPNLTERDRQPEWMDDPTIDPALHRHALSGLARINRFSGATRLLWGPLRELARQTPGRPLRVLDAACGSGDLTRDLARRFRQASIPVEMFGCDLSPTAVATARDLAQRDKLKLAFFRADLLAEPGDDQSVYSPERSAASSEDEKIFRVPFPGEPYDAVCCSLFLHHLEPDQARRLLSRLAAASTRTVLVNDLSRSRTGYLLAWAGTRILTRCPVVHVDGPLSVAAAFTPSEAVRLAEDAGWANITLTRHFPQRYLLRGDGQAEPPVTAADPNSSAIPNS